MTGNARSTPRRKLGPLEWLGIALGVAIVMMAVFGVISVTANGGYYGMMGTGSWEGAWR